MTKEDVQKRVLKNGEPLDLDLFEWDGKTNTFSSDINDLFLDFSNIGHCTFNTGRGCTFTTWGNCTFDTGNDCTFDSGSSCTFDAGSGCTFGTGGNCTFNTDNYCVFNTDNYCVFRTDRNCSFTTGSNCTFDTGSNCTFDVGINCVIVRRDEFEVIIPKEGEVIKTSPYKIKGFISKIKGENDFHMEINGVRVPHIMVDGILSKIISKKGNVYKVINYGEEKETFLVTDGFEKWAHGDTLQKAKKDLLFKLSKKDLSKYNEVNINTEYKVEFLIQMYHDITGACSSGIKYFVSNLKLDLNKKYSINNVIDLVCNSNSYGHIEFKKYFDKK